MGMVQAWYRRGARRRQGHATHGVWRRARRGQSAQAGYGQGTARHVLAAMAWCNVLTDTLVVRSTRDTYILLHLFYFFVTKYGYTGQNIVKKKYIYIHCGIKLKKNIYLLAGVANGLGIGRPQAWGEAHGTHLPRAAHRARIYCCIYFYFFVTRYG